jgi:hypothetical protein
LLEAIAHFGCPFRFNGVDFGNSFIESVAFPLLHLIAEYRSSRRS